MTKEQEHTERGEPATGTAPEGAPDASVRDEREEQELGGREERPEGEAAPESGEPGGERRSGGDRTVALRQERERRRQAEEQAAALKQENERLLREIEDELRTGGGSADGGPGDPADGVMPLDAIQEALDTGNAKALAKLLEERDRKRTEAIEKAILNKVQRRFAGEAAVAEVRREVDRYSIFKDDVFGHAAQRLLAAEIRVDNKKSKIADLVKKVAAEVSQMKAATSPGARRAGGGAGSPPPPNGDRGAFVRRPDGQGKMSLADAHKAMRTGMSGVLSRMTRQGT